MIFGKIDYINLLPFHIFLKKYPLQNAIKQSINYKKGTPSHLNHKLKMQQIDAAIISSIESRHKKYKKIDLGIVAKKNVTSVLVKKQSSYKKDPASATSNALAKVLGLDGEVIIGDNALKLYLENPDAYIDLSQMWNEKTNLPMVFARLCVNKDYKLYKRLAKEFTCKRVKIPNYILNRYAKERKISQKEILNYLSLISYKLGTKEKKGLKRFLKEASKI